VARRGHHGSDLNPFAPFAPIPPLKKFFSLSYPLPWISFKAPQRGSQRLSSGSISSVKADHASSTFFFMVFTLILPLTRDDFTFILARIS